MSNMLDHQAADGSDDPRPPFPRHDALRRATAAMQGSRTTSSTRATVKALCRSEGPRSVTALLRLQDGIVVRPRCNVDLGSLQGAAICEPAGGRLPWSKTKCLCSCDWLALASR